MPNSPLQSSPWGLLGALNLKTLGLAPTQFGEAVVPVVEALQYYTLPNRESVTTGGAVTAEGNVVTILVPAGEVWCVRAISVQLRAQAGAVAADGFGASIAVDFGGPTVRLAAIDTAPLTVTNIASFSATWADSPLLLSGGGSLHAFNNRTYSAAVVDIVLRAFFERFSK